MKELQIDFYDSRNLKSYDLTESMRYQLSMLGSLDNFTRLHSENVANLTCRICEKLHMKDYYIVYCTICAYLHDIGKQFIPPAILQKQSKLTPEEYDIMKKHTTIGHDMCMRDEKLRPYIAGPLYHHEALDGSGYPNGVSDSQIPLEGKIIRVADEFDAITSKRQYKTHIGVVDTLKILVEEAHPSNGAKVGKISPKVLKALIKVIIDDSEYEAYSVALYLEYLQDEIKRLDQIMYYQDQMKKSTAEKDIHYYREGMHQLFEPGETFENINVVYQEYKDAYVKRTDEYHKLKDEIKEIKKLKV